MDELIKRLEDMIENVEVSTQICDWNMVKAYEEQIEFILEKINNYGRQ
jgi:hypothetical protein